LSTSLFDEGYAAPADVDEARDLTLVRSTPHVSVDGKFLMLGADPFRVRGTTYGSFAARADGELFPEASRVRDDFRAMRDAGLNAVRTYTVPPVDVLDGAAELGLQVIAGLHYDDWRAEPRAGRRARCRVLDAGLRAVDEAVERCAGRANLLAIAVGNEVPGDLVRLHGARSVASTLSRLCREVRDAGVLATYVNYPTTEYLQVDDQDLACFNVFLERPAELARYLRHLQVVSGPLPLVVTELGLAAAVHGEDAQAKSLAWQLRAVEEAGCAGASIFSWTDEWAVAGEPVDGWGFGLTDEKRRPKPALEVVRDWAETDVRDLRTSWPSISVVVCARNEEPLLGRCLASLERCDYPGLEVIVCDDGSTDGTRAIAEGFPVRVLPLEHGGLSRARNAGLAAAAGEIVAYLDADAEAQPEWPYRLALGFDDPNVAAAGGPNLTPRDAGFIERAIAEAPGGPIHVLATDDRAEHVPGCNMAFRRAALEEIGGFDPIHTAAGDDVDVCWKLLERGYEIAFAPTAQVDHHRPESIARYLRQQRSYGRSERVLQGRHRHRFNGLGQARWAGSIYGGPRLLPSLLRPIVYHGPMGLAPFQTVHRRRAEHVLGYASATLPLVPAVAALGLLAPVSAWFLAAPLLALAWIVAYATAIAVGVRPGRDEEHPLALRALVAALHVAQPFVRTWGRLRAAPADPLPPRDSDWLGDRAAWLDELRRALAETGRSVVPGGPHDAWDLAVSAGPFVRCRMTTAVAWSWTPLQRTTWRARPAFVVALATAAAAALAFPVPGTLAVAAVFLVAVREVVVVRRAVGRTVGETTRRAR
jgi:GT2 family glycosyltransferase